MPRSHKRFQQSKEEVAASYPTSIYVPRDLVVAVKLKYRQETGGDHSFSHFVIQKMKEYLDEN